MHSPYYSLFGPKKGPQVAKLAEGFSLREKFEGFSLEGFSPQRDSDEGFSPYPDRTYQPNFI